MSKILRINPEFSCEIQMVVPYAYWLHKRGELKTIITSKGMKPFYYFHDDVREEFDYRSVDNYHMEGQIPNIWIHHNSKAVTGKDYNELTEQEQYERLRIEYLAALRESAQIEKDTRDNVSYLEAAYPEDLAGILETQEALEECIKTTDFYARKLYQHLTEDEQ